MEKKPLNTHCEIRRIRNGKPDWDLVPVEEALGLDRAEVKRCPECWGQVRAEAAGGVPPLDTNTSKPTRGALTVLISTARRARTPIPLLRTEGGLQALSPFAAGPSAAAAPGPPRPRVAPRGERRCRRSASRLRSGTPTGCGRHQPDPGVGGEVGHFPWLALGRFRARDRLLGRPRWSAVTGPPWPLVFPVLPFPSDPFRPSTYLGPGPSARERPRNTKTGRLLARGCAPGRMGFRWNPLWPGVGIIAASFAAGTCCPGGERVALQSRGTLRWRSSVVTGSR
jgi:hypothetical protein